MLNICDQQKDLPAKGNMIAYWLGGSGFIIRFDNGQTVCIDPYLSDLAERLFDFKRLFSPPVSSEQLRFDILLMSHDHADHMDIDSFDQLTLANPACRILTPICCEEFLKDKKADYEIISVGQSISIGDMSIKAVAADHGDLCPEAIGFLLKYSSRLIYFTGDTSFNKESMQPAIDAAPEILLPCINGAYGNMNEEQAAKLCKSCNATTVIPSHYGLFKEHNGSVTKFVECLKIESPQTTAYALKPGQGVEI